MRLYYKEFSGLNDNAHDCLAEGVKRHHILCSGEYLDAIVSSMNKRSVKKIRAAKASRATALRKASVRKASARKTPARQPVRKPETVGAASIVGAVTVAQIVARTSSSHTHKYRVGQTVFYTSSPISRPGATGSYEVVRLLPSDGEDYQYRIKHAGEAFERVAKESQLEVEF
jgi:hypothetical protein